MGRRAQVKGDVGQNGDTTVEGIKHRMQDGLDGRPLTWLADRTNDGYKNVQRWVAGEVAPPVDFIARYCQATGIAEEWILTGRPPKVKLKPEVAAEALEIVRSVLRHLEANLRLLDQTPAKLEAVREIFATMLQVKADVEKRGGNETSR